jgi:AGCS family alanine or glycine:cation symporter
VKGKYSRDDDPGEITHFQALSAAVSGTVGLGNIAGVAIAVSMGGPGAAFWMVMLGLCGMTSKFAECTLGVKYRHIDKDGKVHGGGMLYLTRGFAERGLGPLGKTLAVFFGICCVGASFGGGNMYQINQAASQLVNVTGGPETWLGANRWIIGLVVAVFVGVVIIGGITRIANLTAKLVPGMSSAPTLTKSFRPSASSCRPPSPAKPLPVAWSAPCCWASAGRPSPTKRASVPPPSPTPR